MGWLETGDAACDNEDCKQVRICVSDRALAIQMMRAGGWRHMQGETLGGQSFETILCRDCVTGEKRRTRSKEVITQDDLPIDWEKGRVVVGKQGVQSR